MTPRRPSATIFQRCCVAAVTAAMLLQPLAAYSVTLTNSYLNETPLQGLNKVKPNIVFTVDDSGSMSQEYLPDFAAEGPTNTPQQIYYCRDGMHCGGIANSLVGPWVISRGDPPIRSSNHNKQFYDPTAAYLPGKRGDSGSSPAPNLPYEASSPGNFTSVYVSGYAGYPGANNGGTVNLAAAPNLVSGYPDTAWCTVLASNAADFMTAFTDGSKCRLNGKAYSAFTDPSNTWRVPSVAAGYNYPNSRDITNGTTLTNTTCSAANEYCVFNVPVTVYGNPYYYTITKVQFCSNADALGFGTAPCQDRWDQNTSKYIRYGTSAALSLDPQAFTRVDIVPTTLTYTNGRTYAEEMANFAKWYTFYRDRVSAIKSAGGLAFSGVTQEQARIGFHTLHENATLFQNVAPFDSTQKTTWFNKLYAVVPNGGTPLPDAVFRIGEYFANSGASGLPGAVDPLDSETGMCQLNYHLLATDGYWNSPLSTGSVGDRDLTAPGSLPPTDPTPPALPPSTLDTQITLGAQFPRPYYEGPTPTNNSLADLAMHYFITDLRTSLPNRVEDPLARWQHVTLFGVSQGAQGSIPYPSGLIEITGDPNAQPNAIPPTRDWPPATGAGGPESVDDLWHAALNSHGQFATAQNPQELAKTINTWISNITQPDGTGTGIAVGAQISRNGGFGYRTAFKGLWGDVLKYQLDLNTGVPIGNSAMWSAATQLETVAGGSGWDTNRRIITTRDDSNAVVPFRYNNLSPGQQRMLTQGWLDDGNTNPPSQQAVLNFLRGDRSNEPDLRVRPSGQLLGDIVYSGAVVVGAPSQPYVDAGNPGYERFKTLARTQMVYVGSNDGMVHAFIDSCPPPSTDPSRPTPPCSPPVSTDAGKELWAYVPKVLLGDTIYSSGNPNEAPHTPDADYQLGALAYTVFPNFQHRFYVNATPRAWDVDFANAGTSTPPTSGNGDWRTLLVGGLGAGGRSVYALDVTSPPIKSDGTPMSENEIVAARKVLWEFTDPELGYVFDPPTIVKTKAYGWVVLVNSGYNNPGGNGVLFVLDPRDGTPLARLHTGVGSDGDPSGLSTIRAYTPSRRDPIALQAYGGDLKGNVWRFDLSDVNAANWKAELIAQLTDGANPQPITTGIRIEIDQNNDVDRYIFVGTGKLLGVNTAPGGIDDINSTAVRNSLYVIRDGTRLAPEPKPGTPYSRTDLNSVNATTGALTGTSTRGWYQDATDPKEKIGTDVFADVQTVVFAFSKPTVEPCAAPLSSRLYARDFTTGQSVLVAPGGNVVEGYDIGSGIAGFQLIQGQSGSGGTASGEIRALVTTMKGEVFSFALRPPSPPAVGHRVSWRLLNKN